MTPVSSFTVFTADGRERTFEGNAEGFIVVWQQALRNPEREWPHAYVDPGTKIVGGISRISDGSVVHFNPHQIVAVEVQMSEDG